jgi:hypothetical protein
MTLDDAFEMELTSDHKGLRPLFSEAMLVLQDIKINVNEDNLFLLKRKITEMKDLVRSIQIKITYAETRASELTITETGAIMDVSVPPHQRK